MKNSAGKLSELKPRIRREEIKLRIDELKPYIDELESHINKLKPRIRRETTNDNLHRSLIESIDDWLMKKMISVTF